MSSITKMAKKDAEKAMLADMFYGKGAGTRRKLLMAELESKKTMPGYTEAFTKAYDSLDQNKFAKMAIKERKQIDRAAKTTKNINALKTGNHKNLSNGLLLAVGGYYFLRATGYDEIVADEAKRLYKKAKAYAAMEVEKRKATRG